MGGKNVGLGRYSRTGAVLKSHRRAHKEPLIWDGPCKVCLIRMMGLGLPTPPLITTDVGDLKKRALRLARWRSSATD